MATATPGETPGPSDTTSLVAAVLLAAVVIINFGFLYLVYLKCWPRSASQAPGSGQEVHPVQEQSALQEDLRLPAERESCEVLMGVQQQQQPPSMVEMAEGPEAGSPLADLHTIREDSNGERLEESSTTCSSGDHATMSGGPECATGLRWSSEDDARWVSAAARGANDSLGEDGLPAASSNTVKPEDMQDASIHSLLQVFGEVPKEAAKSSSYTARSHIDSSALPTLSLRGGSPCMLPCKCAPGDPREVKVAGAVHHRDVRLGVQGYLARQADQSSKLGKQKGKRAKQKEKHNECSGSGERAVQDHQVDRELSEDRFQAVMNFITTMPTDVASEQGVWEIDDMDDNSFSI